MTRFITMRKGAKNTLQMILAVCFWLLLWQAASVCVNSKILLVSPFAVLKTLFDLLFTGAFWRTVAFSAARMISGFFLALCVGAVLAAIGARWQFVRILLRPLMLTVKSVPVASFIILALLWLKNAGNLAVFISFLMVLPIIYTNTLTGILQTDQKLLEMAHVFRVPVLQRIRYLVLPAVFPPFKAACNVGLGLCWKSGVSAEVIGITTGSIGAALYNAKIFFSTAELFAWTLVIVLLSLLFEKLFLFFLDKIETALTEDGL
ncbi:MAG: ABC transporter permease subunit [Ruthenibacterium sp.]